MSIHAHTAINRLSDSHRAGIQAATAISQGLGPARATAVLAYASVEHDAEVYLQAIRSVLGDVPIVGCSTSGLMAQGVFWEEAGYMAGALALGGSSVQASVGVSESYQTDTLAKGQALGQKLRRAVQAAPKAVILFGDPLCGADMEGFAAAVSSEVGCPVIGGGAGQPWGQMVQTFQYCGTQVYSHAATALVLAGDFTVAIGCSTGTVPTPVTATVTRVDHNVLLELDGRPALAVFSEFVGRGLLTELTNDINTTVALGFTLPDAGAGTAVAVRGPFALDLQRSGLVMAASVPVGTQVVFHRRSVVAALSGAEKTAQDLARQVAGRRIRAVLGFECGARTAPLLGRAEALREQQLVQQSLAPDAHWLGTLAWGELAPLGERTTYHNYSYPLLVIADQG